MNRLLWLGFLVVDQGCPNNARLAHGQGVPEIDGIALGLALILLGGVLLIWGSHQKKS